MYGIDIESINLTKNGIEKQFILSKEKNVTSLIRSKNSFIKFDYNNGLNFEYSIFKNYKKRSSQQYEIFNPFFYKEKVDTFSVRIFTEDVVRSRPNIKIKNAEILDLILNKNTINFKFVSHSFVDELSLDFIKFRINKILIYTKNRDKLEVNDNGILHINSDKRTFFKIYNAKYNAFGSFKKNEVKNLNALLNSKPTEISAQFWFYNIQTKKWDSYTKNNILVSKNSILSFKNNQIFTSPNVWDERNQ